MNFQKILKQIAAENHTTTEDVYREMRISIEDAYRHRNEQDGSMALWNEMGFKDQCPTPEQFILKTARKLRAEKRAADRRWLS